MKRGEDLGGSSQLLFSGSREGVLWRSGRFFKHAAALGRPSGDGQAIGSEERDWRGPGHAPREMARDSGGGNARSHGRLSAGPAGGSIGFLKKR